MANLELKISAFIGKAITRCRELTTALIDEFDYVGHQSVKSSELLLQISECNRFVKLLIEDDVYHGGLTDRQVSDLIDFFTLWLELNDVVAANYTYYKMPVQNTIVQVPAGNYATVEELAAEIVARTAADQALSDRITALENAGPEIEWPEGFFNNYNTTYAVVFDDDDRLHTHANIASLDQLTEEDILRIKALEAHYASIGDPGGIHVNQEDRDRWDAGAGGGATSIKTQAFVADGSTASFTVTVGVMDVILAVYVNGNFQTPTTHYNHVGNAIVFSDNLPNTWRVTVVFAEGISVGTGADTVYDLSSPSTVTVGGMPAGTVLTGRTLKSIIEEMAVDYLLPAFTSFDMAQAALIEVGTTLSGNKTFTWNISNSANVQPNTVAIRDVTSNTLIASGLANDGSEIVDIGVISNTGPINRAWRAEAQNTNAQTLISGQKTVRSDYPYFFGKVASGGAAPGASRPVANQALINSGTKVMQESNGDISINFTSTSDDYIWFAIPSTKVSKQSWYVDALNNGSIGGSVGAGGNLFPNYDTVVIDSPTALWNDISYKIYISNYQTAVAVAMQLRNAA